jgi:hypothetical protein
MERAIKYLSAAQKTRHISHHTHTMQKRIALLLLLASSLYAAAQTAPVPCPSGSRYTCTILLTYDAGGNRTAWQEVNKQEIWGLGLIVQDIGMSWLMTKTFTFTTTHKL